jgi:predicted RNA-binding Zn-ribbon protein involved in translation (DUF1610 family)
MKDNKDTSISNGKEKIIDFTKQLEEKESNIKDDVTNVTNVTDVTDVTDVTNACVTFVTSNKHINNVIFGDSTFEKILEILLMEKRGFTYGELALKLGKSEATIKMAVARKKEYFGQNKPDGKVVVVTLVTHAINKIYERIENYNKKLELEAKFEQEKESKLNSISNKREEMLLEAKAFFELYKSELDTSISNGVIYLDFEKISEFSPSLSEELIKNPEETLSVLEMGIEEMDLIKLARVRIKNLPSSSNVLIEDIRGTHLNEFICIKAKIIQSSDARPQAVNAKFECPSCGTIISVLQIEKKFREPTRCSCGRRGGFKLLSKEMVDTARIIIQDLQENSENSSPKRLDCFVKEDLASKFVLNKMLKAGNDVLVNGVLKEVPVPLPRGGLSTRFQLALEVNYVELAQ